MTLILTELSKHGIAMAADSALTCIHASTGLPKLANGPRNKANKLFFIDHLNVGISAWGLFQVFDIHTGKDYGYVDNWLQNFITAELAEWMPVRNVAALLADRLNEDFKGNLLHCEKIEGLDNRRMGFHVAGFEEVAGVYGPSFYHVNNGCYVVLRDRKKNKCIENGVEVSSRFKPEESPPIREFRPNHDMSPKEFMDKGYWFTRNGDFGLFVDACNKYGGKWLSRRSKKLDSSLENRGKALRLFISHVIRSGSKPIYHISEPIQVVLLRNK